MSMTIGSAKVLLVDILAQNQGRYVPQQYVRAFHDRPNLKEVVTPDAESIPLVDLGGIEGPRRSEVVDKIGRACLSDGFFQVKNHGIPDPVVQGMLQIAREFFRLPEAERLESYSDDTTKTTRLSTSFNVRTEEVGSWRDFLRLDCYPLEDHVHGWPNKPPSFRDLVGEYTRHARGLALKLLGAISESLGLERDHMEKALGRQAQHMAINYYPPCPDPELTYGLPGHKDANAITLLLQDEVPGLQVLRNGKWVAINPIPNTLIINIGDMVQVLSNDKYKSVLHRAVVNSDRERISVATFYSPSMDALLEPPSALVDEANPRVYRGFTYGEYFKKFWSGGLRTESCLDLFKNGAKRHILRSML